MTKEKENNSRTDFSEFLFGGFPTERKKRDNTINLKGLLNNDCTKAVIRVSSDMLFKTRYGFALKTSPKKVVFLKTWQVNGWMACEAGERNDALVWLNKDYFFVKEFGNHTEGSEEADHWDFYVRVAQAQSEYLQKCKSSYAWDLRYRA